MDADIEPLMVRQEGVIAAWQMAAAGLTPKAIAWRTRSMRRLQSGVYVSGHGPVTGRQRWWAAVATAPGSVLAYTSAAECHGFMEPRSQFDQVVRPGRGPRRRSGSVLVSYSRSLAGDVGEVCGLPVLVPARVIADLSLHLPEHDIRRMVRDALRTGVLDPATLASRAAARCGRPGGPLLAVCAEEYGSLPATRARSDAEVLALALLAQDGIALPSLNVRRAGFEADLSWPVRKLIVELDGPSFHKFASEDRKRDRAWRAAGWSVHRVPTDVVYDAPERFVALVRAWLAALTPRAG